MNLPAARFGIYLLLSILAVAAIAGGLARKSRADAIAEAAHATWGAAAG